MYDNDYNRSIMKKCFMSIFFVIFMFSLSNGVYAKSPCASVLCLSGLLTGDNPSECEKHIDDYFSIRKFKRGKWRVGKTIEKRYEYLKKCPEGKDKNVKINATYGHIYDI